MGKRAPQTDEAHEYKDMYFREVLIDLDSTTPDLPVSLRVQVRIDAENVMDKASKNGRQREGDKNDQMADGATRLERRK
jgi:hypothetical protein